MMPATGAGFAGFAAEGVGATAMRRLARAVVRILDRLVPPRRSARGAGLPPEFYKFPPV